MLVTVPEAVQGNFQAGIATCTIRGQVAWPCKLLKKLHVTCSLCWSDFLTLGTYTSFFVLNSLALNAAQGMQFIQMEKIPQATV